MDNRTPATKESTARSWISFLDGDLLQNIIAKLPALSFASAACVSHTWNDVCGRILSRPILTSALSLHPSLPEAMKEVVEKVLTKPIRPHFAILCISPTTNLDEVHRLAMQKLGSKTPIITCDAGGIIGKEALTEQFKEVMFPCGEDEVDDPTECEGISLTVGYVPGLKVDAIPLMGPVKGHSIDNFVTDIRDYSAFVSGDRCPAAVFMFGDSRSYLKPLLEKLDYALPERTIIAGNQSCNFRWASVDNSSFNSRNELGKSPGAVGLVFASDRNAPNGALKIDFYCSVGAGVTALGPTYRVVSAKVRSEECSTWLTAKREGETETLDGEQILEDLANIVLEMGTPNTHNYDLYIGITKKRKCSIGSEKVKAVTSLSYHSVQQGDEEYLYVRGLDIKTGDSFRFYVPDSKFALRQCETVSKNLGSLRHEEVVGGFLFSCCGRGPMFFGQQNADSSPILDNFPGIPLSGMFCDAEIGRAPPKAVQLVPGDYQNSARCYLHVYSSIYVLMSCTKPSSSASMHAAMQCHRRMFLGPLILDGKLIGRGVVTARPIGPWPL